MRCRRSRRPRATRRVFSISAAAVITQDFLKTVLEFPPGGRRRAVLVLTGSSSSWKPQGPATGNCGPAPMALTSIRRNEKPADGVVGESRNAQAAPQDLHYACGCRIALCVKSVVREAIAVGERARVFLVLHGCLGHAGFVLRVVWRNEIEEALRAKDCGDCATAGKLRAGSLTVREQGMFR
jgi:hypothetical protein